MIACGSEQLPGDGVGAACPLCGFRSTGAFPECGGCTLRRSCTQVRCPNCGYRTVESSRLLDWLSEAYEWIVRRDRPRRDRGGGHGRMK